MAWMAGRLQTGHWASLPSQTLLAQSTQKKLWPQGTSAWVTLASEHTRHLVAELSNESAGEVLLEGEGRVGAETEAALAGLAPPADAGVGESPSPSSLSLPLQMAPRSLPLLLELLEHDPELEKAPLLPVDEVMAGKKLIGLCTDGAPAMIGVRSGSAKKLKEKNPARVSTHCVIHRQALASKTLPQKLRQTLDSPISIVNYMECSALNSRLFTLLCEDLDSDHKVPLFHTEVR
ncbi:unnamed protein product [Acanthoscelides obtectus]|uniref:SCAN domain-containing protein 3 n=1 Tax=Acanthoscelides obtectus TaxID=200917 RepID=A0A9P0MHX8_ACAOB|nr:unnamed protein product [Acanthoscelides obtectus]CAK1643575.1 SCAN domain-containing protein 3 [Acanthoscelides obtectus]